MYFHFSAMAYDRRNNQWCSQNTKMSSTTISGAKLECNRNPKCSMFYDQDGKGKKFKYCGSNAIIAKDNHPTEGLGLYTKINGKTI